MTNPQPDKDLAYEIAVELYSAPTFMFNDGGQAETDRYWIEKTAEIIRARIAPVLTQAAQDATEADGYAQVMVERDALREQLAQVEQELQAANGTVRGVIHALKLNEEQGIVNQCTHLKDELDELRMGLAEQHETFAATEADNYAYLQELKMQLETQGVIIQKYEPKLDELQTQLRAARESRKRLIPLVQFGLECERDNAENWLRWQEAKRANTTG